MRLFTALDIKPEDRKRIFSWADSYLLLPAGKIAQTNYHITLAFFGDIQQQNIEPLVNQLTTLNERSSLRPFLIRLDQVAFWPKTGIIWIGPSAWPQDLSRLSASHASAGTRYGARKSNRAYQPHISLTRGAQEMSPPLLAPAIELQISDVALYESQQNSYGKVEYHPVERWHL
jgi:2'-5' RNA ligase